MKKFTLLIASLFIAIGAMAQTFTITPSNGSFNKTGWAASWTSSGLDIQITFNVQSGANNMDANNTTNFAIYSGTAKTSTYVLAVDANYKILSYSFKFASNNGNTITAGEKSMTANTTEQQTFEVTDINSNSTSFVLAGDNSGISITDFTITVESLGTTYEFVTAPDGFASGKVYTFESQRGWLMTKEGVDYVYSSGKSNANVTTPAYDNAYCQWIYYATEQGKYLYNVGSEKFISYNSSDLNSIPLAEIPTTGALEFEASTLTTTYPILAGLENAAINHNVSNNSFTYGALLWSDGWTQEKWANDAGSAHRVMELFDAETEVLASVETAVNVFEAKTVLHDALVNAITLFNSITVGNAVGEYSSSIDGCEEEFVQIQEYYETISKTTPVDEINQKTTRVGEIVASFSLNMPEAGNYYRLKGVSGNYVDATSIYNEATAKVGQMSMRSAEECNLAGTIFYYDSESHLLNYATGTYTKETREIGSVGANKSIWNITASPRNNATYALEDTNRENVNNGAHLHDNEGNRADRCSSNCGTRHDFTIEEVTSLPVTITDAQYATFFAPVEVTVPDGVEAYYVTADGVNSTYITLAKIENGVVPANTGVILYAEAGTYNLDITSTGATAINGNLLSGTAAATYVTDDAYVLSNQDGEIGLYKATKNQSNNSAWKNNSHKAYLPASAVPAAAQASNGFRFGEGTTGIDQITENREQSTVIYDLTGRKIENVTAPGIYIIGGKKVLVK